MDCQGGAPEDIEILPAGSFHEKAAAVKPDRSRVVRNDVQIDCTAADCLGMIHNPPDELRRNASLPAPHTTLPPPWQITCQSLLLKLSYKLHN